MHLSQLGAAAFTLVVVVVGSLLVSTQCKVHANIQLYILWSYFSGVSGFKIQEVQAG